MTLDAWPMNCDATVAAIDWAALSERDARRLRELGFDAGVTVTPLHHGGLLTRDPLALRVGRMTIAIRRAHAAAVTVEAA